MIRRLAIIALAAAAVATAAACAMTFSEREWKVGDYRGRSSRLSVGMMYYKSVCGIGVWWRGRWKPLTPKPADPRSICGFVADPFLDGYREVTPKYHSAVGPVSVALFDLGSIHALTDCTGGFTADGRKWYPGTLAPFPNGAPATMEAKRSHAVVVADVWDMRLVFAALTLLFGSYPLLVAATGPLRRRRKRACASNAGTISRD